MRRTVQRLLLWLVFLGGSGSFLPGAALPGWAREAGVSVRWLPWNPPALAEAAKDGRSVYLFVAPGQSELARATLAQTLARKETADWLNDNFVCVFADADRYPEVAAYVQHYLASVKQSGGWPAHVWLTPELRPYDGANYLPATEEWGRPGFLKSARTALDLWKNDPAGARALADEAMELMRLEPVGSPDAGAIEALLERGTTAWVAAADAVNGGFGAAPKNPEAEVIRFLLERNEEGRAVALKAARALVTRGLHDRKFGGFFRRTLDAEWAQPVREKTLFDQARIALALFAAAQAGGGTELRDAGIRALEFAFTRMRYPDRSWAMSVNEPEAGGPAVLRGKAGPAVLGNLVLALVRSGGTDQAQQAQSLAADLEATLAKGLLPDGGPLTVHDLLAASIAVAAVGQQAESAWGEMEADRFFDPSLGYFMASSGEPGAGVPLKVPALTEPFRAEAFALQWRPAARDAGAMRGRLWWICEYDPLPPGEILLSLSAAAGGR